MTQKYRYNLFLRLITPIALLLLVIAAGLTAAVITESNRTIESFRALQAASHARTLASGSMDAILTRDYTLLENWVHAAIPGDDYAYAYIANDGGLILAHTNFSFVGKRITLQRPAAMQQIETRYDERSVTEIVQPIELGAGFLGTAHVAYYQSHGLALLPNLASNLLAPLLVALLLFGLALYAIARRTTDPIHVLTRTIASSSLNDLKPIPASITTQKNEIGELASTFQDMQSDLRNSYDRLRDALEQLDRQKTHLETMLHSIGDAVITTDNAGRVEYLNPAGEALLGWHQDQVQGQHIGEIYHGEQDQRQLWELLEAQCLKGGAVMPRSEQPIVNRQGERIFIEQSAAPIRDAAGNINGLIIVAHDVTREQILQQELLYKASHDDLTGLRNRVEFNRQLQEFINSAKLDHKEHALLFLDLDQFKLVNDTCGHTAGDELLRRVGHILSGEIRRHDILARLGGDEFTIILADCSLAEAEPIAEKIRRAIESFIFIWDNQRFNITTSIGLAPITADNLNQQKLLSLADAACYAAKHNGRNRIYRYDENDSLLNQHYGEVNWISRINQAIAEDRLALYFQTIEPINARDAGQHLEILVRLQDETGRLIPPSAFIPAAERYNLMPTVDRWVVSRTCHWFARHPEILGQVGVVSVNLSGETLNDSGFADFVLQLFGECGMDGSKLCFEITETTAIGNLIVAQEFMARMQAIGCRFALDDFGTGMSSFGYLKTLPVDFLKIDGIFIQNIASDPIDYAMVRSINDIGHLLGQQTIAEFVENADILKRLQEIGIDYAQGYHFSRPVPLEDLHRLVSPLRADTGRPSS
ncbi:diguanylate cyclase/phosphodiesterase [Thiohalobacter thiocyanaticus]|uniref:Diguanylate cyclase/phosphodiesterase n=1 Tax=Thiohalobacter thiocyanaticus TaxID=585455 RepID=A0A1Z4VQM5_9GAMM|nr:EAL domain-containing protein [Thiohalobacter thiocyanaticus]BAZ93939.1 diguanylate cyclase/phosphodiesterase [Thiohalobacter thiocyanaticus]